MKKTHARTRPVFRMLAVVLGSMLVAIAIERVFGSIQEGWSSAARTIGIAVILGGSAYRLTQPDPTDDAPH